MISEVKKRIRGVFLVDAIGAVISAIFLGIVLPIFPEYFAMPLKTLYYLAGLAILFSIYSSICALFPPNNYKLFIYCIAMVNSSYCLLTFSLFVYFFKELKSLDLIYFMGEIAILLILIRWEFKKARGFGICNSKRTA